MEGENSDNGEHIEQQGGNRFEKLSNNVDQQDLNATPTPSDNTDQSSELEAQKTPPHDTYNKPPKSQLLDDDEAKRMFLRRLIQTISTVDMPYTSTHHQDFDVTLKQKSSQPPYTSRYNRPKTAYKKAMNGKPSASNAADNMDQRDLDATSPPSDNTDQCSGLQAKKTSPDDTHNKPPKSQSLDDDEAKRMFLRKLIETISNANGEEKSTVDMPYTSTHQEHFDVTLKQKASQPPYTSRYNKPKIAYKRAMIEKPSTSNAADNVDQQDLDATPLTDQCSELKAKNTSPNDTYSKPSKSQSLDDEEAKMFVLKLNQAISKAKDEQKSVHIPSTRTYHQRFEVMLKQQASQKPSTSGYNRHKFVCKRATNEEPSTSMKTYSKMGKSAAVNVEGGNIDEQEGNHFGKCSNNMNQRDLEATPPPSDNTNQCSGLEAKKTPPHDTYNKSPSLDDDEAKRMFVQRLIETISNANSEEKSTVDMPYTSTHQEHFDVTLKQKASQPPYTSRYNKPKIAYKRAMIEKPSTSNAADNVDQRDLDATAPPSNDTDQYSELKAKTTPPEDTDNKPSKSRSLDDDIAKKMFLSKLTKISNAIDEQKSGLDIPSMSTHHQQFDVKLKRKASQKPSTSGDNTPKIAYKKATNGKRSRSVETYSQKGKTDEARKSEGTDLKSKAKLRGKKTEKSKYED